VIALVGHAFLHIFGGSAIAEGGYGGAKIVQVSYTHDRFIADIIEY
jgi:hypothetical protein